MQVDQWLPSRDHDLSEAGVPRLPHELGDNVDGHLAVV